MLSHYLEVDLPRASLLLNPMVHHSAATFSALADPVRIGIVTQLASGETAVSDIAARYDISLQAVCKHLSVLESAEIISSRKVGRVRLCVLRKARIEQAIVWLSTRAKLWDARLDALAEIVEERRKK